MVPVVIRPHVRVDGELSTSDLALLESWVTLNLSVLVKYWDGDIEDTLDAIEALRRIESPETTRTS
jgi:hypothetical protein